MIDLLSPLSDALASLLHTLLNMASDQNQAEHDKGYAYRYLG